MEAKVDIQKLQMLNDRINQTIDALNQVRLSVHGLGHTGMTPGDPRFQPYSLPQAFLPPLSPQAGLTHLGIDPRINPFLAQQGGYLGAGLQHSPLAAFGGGVNPYVGVANPFSGFVNPYAGGLNPYLGISPLQTPWPFAQVRGLQHSAPDVMEQRVLELRASDPYRITQTFPYAFALQSPLIPLW